MNWVVGSWPVSKLGGWKHTIAFHKSSKTNTHQALIHLRQYWCYGNLVVIRNWGGWWTFRNWGDIGLSPARRETTQTNKPPKHYIKMGAITSTVLLRKRGYIPNGSVPPQGSKSNKRRLTVKRAQLLKINFQMSSIWAKGCMLVIVCVLSDLTWLPLLGRGWKSLYIIIITKSHKIYSVFDQ